MRGFFYEKKLISHFSETWEKRSTYLTRKCQRPCPIEREASITPRQHVFLMVFLSRKWTKTRKINKNDYNNDYDKNRLIILFSSPFRAIFLGLQFLTSVSPFRLWTNVQAIFFWRQQSWHTTPPRWCFPRTGFPRRLHPKTHGSPCYKWFQRRLPGLVGGCGGFAWIFFANFFVFLI